MACHLPVTFGAFETPTFRLTRAKSILSCQPPASSYCQSSVSAGKWLWDEIVAGHLLLGHAMTKGLWIVAGIFGLFLMSCWLADSRFLHDNVWRNDKLAKADELTQQVDFLALRVEEFVSQLVAGTLYCLVTVLIYFAVRVRRLEKRIDALEHRLSARDGV